MLPRMGWSEQRQYPRLGLGLPVTLLFLGSQFGNRFGNQFGGQSQNGQVEAELQDISRGGCFFKSNLEMAIDKRISVVLSATGGRTCQASGWVVRTLAYKGFAVLFDEAESSDLDELLRDLAPLPQESRAALLSAVLRPEIQIY
jgi:PilZ domain-containing protein